MQKPTSILLIDDDNDEYFLFKKIVQGIDAGIECHHAEDGEKGIKMLSGYTNLPDYIFLDLNMPRVDGKQCLIEIKKSFKVPVVIYTTSSSPNDVAYAQKNGAAWFLTKPTLLRDMEKALALILKADGQKYDLPENGDVHQF